MNDILAKLSSYNIFNYLFPGVIFVVIANKLTSYNLLQQDILAGAFLYFFIGLVISRIGSIFIEPVLKFMNFIKFEEYKKYAQACKTDKKIETLSEINNMYRTICSLFLMLVALKMYEWLSQRWLFLQEMKIEIAIIFFFFLFLFSYRKQTKYITKRIQVNE